MDRKINVKLIQELRAACLSRNVIADTRHISRHSVSDVFAVDDKMGATYEDIRGMEGMTDTVQFSGLYIPDDGAVFFNMKRYNVASHDDAES
ncbi:MAG: hypothetical protein J6I76_17510 [Oribacterium sp.]|nr:hypothetical protein [Oribacterium sp.]